MQSLIKRKLSVEIHLRVGPVGLLVGLPCSSFRSTESDSSYWKRNLKTHSISSSSFVNAGKGGATSLGFTFYFRKVVGRKK